MLNIVSSNLETLRKQMIYHAGYGGKAIIIVPEQYTLQTERELMSGLGLPGFFDLEVLSPSRLTERVFALAGSDGRVRIDARGKQLTLARTMLKCKKQLKYYESAAEKQGFIQRIGALIAEFKRSGVTPEQLEALANGQHDEASRDKLLDLSLLYSEYCSRLSNQFVDGEDVLDEMLRRLPDSGVAKDARVVLFGFDVLTGQMNRLLIALSKISQDVQVLILSSQLDAFAPVNESIQRLIKEAKNESIPCAFTPMEFSYQGQSGEIAHLSQQYLLSPGQPYPGVPTAIRLYAAPSPFFEAHFAAQEMVLLHEKGISYGDMAVAMGDESFSCLLATVLASYRIPAYVSRKLPAVSHGASRFMLFSLRALSSGYQADDMLAVIKSGYAPIAQEEAWRLENYVLSYGIRGKLWLAPFQRGSAEECAQVEEARIKVISPLNAFREKYKASQMAGDALRYLYEYLDETRVFDRLTSVQEELLSRGMDAEASQIRQVWEATMQLLSQAYSLLDGTHVSPRQLASWLEAGLEACELSSLPPSAEAVACGRIGNLPLSRPKVMFMMNMTDGILSGAANGLLTPGEQEAAQKELKVYLSLDGEGQDALARLDVWKALSSPTDFLYITRSQATQEGAALRPLAQLSHIRHLFPGLVEEGSISQRSAARLPLAPGPALDALGVKIRDGSLEKDWLDAWHYLSQSEQAKYQSQALIEAFTQEKNAPPLPREVTHSLFMERVMSVSRLESFAVCPYKHFVEQGLLPKPRKEWKLTPIDAGNFYHSALEGFTRLLPTIPHWPRIDRKTCDAAIDQAAEPMMQQMLSGVMGDSARMRALGEKYRKVLHRVAWTFTRGARQSAFTTQDAEVKFGYPGGIPPIELKLRDGRSVYVRGIIDRIDRYAGDEGVYLRVVDYKSGREKLDPAKIFYGAQLQLLLYLQAALMEEEEALPAGAFYMRVADPLLPDQEDTQLVEDALAKALCLKGVALKDAAILKKMDDGEPPLTLPKVLTADGGFDKRAQLANLEDLRNLISYAGEMAKNWAEHMRSGEISASPLCDKNKNGPCDYCDYAAICRRDLNQGLDNARIMQEMKFDELLEKINR